MGGDPPVVRREAMLVEIDALPGAQGRPAGDDRNGERGRPVLLQRVDLYVWKRQMRGKNPAAAQAARHILAHSKGDPDLADVRGESAIAKLPADERDKWHAFWAEVGAALGG